MRLVRFLELRNLIRGQLNAQCGESVLQLIRFAGTDDGRGDAKARENPGQRNLRVLDAASLCNLSKAIDDREVRSTVIQAVRELVRSGARGFTLFLVFICFAVAG
jgi:hypothetical protein